MRSSGVFCSCWVRPALCWNSVVFRGHEVSSGQGPDPGGQDPRNNKMSAAQTVGESNLWTRWGCGPQDPWMCFPAWLRWPSSSPVTQFLVDRPCCPDDHVFYLSLQTPCPASELRMCSRTRASRAQEPRDRPWRPRVEHHGTLCGTVGRSRGKLRKESSGVFTLATHGRFFDVGVKI